MVNTHEVCRLTFFLFGKSSTSLYGPHFYENYSMNTFVNSGTLSYRFERMEGVVKRLSMTTYLVTLLG